MGLMTEGSVFKERVGDDDVVTFDDTSIVAFLHYKGHRFEPYSEAGGRVKFRIFGNVSEDLRLFYEDEKVNIQSYVKCLKTVRSSMFTLKTVNEQYGQ